ncbi:MAG: phosphomannomutase/phosphoglucomutase [Candidatus Magasanikbacteria bacterium]|jgi:phosphomannomutase|nr:phosphomannomutase/phosphoglucomutase [Candidatus Magasanikbacteria bacterium]MBT4221508.1 phosphomannomutase/phosphoglucomutase [Candidatus Magasanikbacteria bacterium]MBT4350459.1 phosphomannomutase/phosphoglucomutase [Candidatus Magasanikbacteria bacterium]MBT4541846.1 phosphomannomutase/phosphoglucomutase [Candidatus Magasanikbacteria bacterium]MBT6253375.1 phosphomannomutase/phosphoglucomutase [Candidatus Magasanikbacteria bacterium]
MSFPSHIFKAYDIRGKYPNEINEDLVERIAKAFAVFIKEDTKKEDVTLVVCQDMRDSSIPLKNVVIKALRDQGVNIVDIGLASTPTFYFGVGYLGVDGGIQITASHNPAEYNGCKMVRAKAVPVSGETGIYTIRDLAEKNEWIKQEQLGSYAKVEGILEKQIDYARSRVAKEGIKPFNIVIDPGNGMGGPLMEALFTHLPCTVEKLFFELDGTFPNHESNPLKEKNNKDIQEKVREIGADLGIALDGDADRIFFIDEKGETVPPAILRGVLAQIILRDHAGASIGYDIRPGRITVDLIEEAGGIPVVTRVGHSLIKEKAREIGAPFAGESSGHFFYDSPYGFFEMPELVTLYFLKELSESGKTLSEFIAPFKRYIHSGEINFSVEDKQKVFDALLAKYEDHFTYDFDGVTFEWKDWWFNVRASNTENTVRLNLEGMNEDIVKEKVEEVSQIIKE